MTKLLIRNLFSVLISALAASTTSLLLNYYHWFSSGNWAWSLVYYVLICVVFNTVYAYHRRRNDFTSMLLAGIVIRLLISLVVLVICMVLKMPEFAAFAVHFIAHYILFTAFEIRYLSSLIKHTKHEK